MRGHANGPFTNLVNEVFPNLRVQKVIILTPNTTKQVYLEASPTDPVLLKFKASTDTALSTGTNVLLVGNPTTPNAYMASGDSNPGSGGISGEKQYVLTSNTTIIAGLTSTAIAASLALTISAITSANTQTVVIGGQTYTLNTALTDTANNVLIGADTTAMAANLAAAINAGAGSGTTYGTGTVANASVTATSALGVLTVTAKTPGTAGNSVAVSETLTNASWAGGATALAGGANATTTGQMTVFIDA